MEPAAEAQLGFEAAPEPCWVLLPAAHQAAQLHYTDCMALLHLASSGWAAVAAVHFALLLLLLLLHLTS
jgi:hypothetical protein